MHVKYVRTVQSTIILPDPAIQTLHRGSMINKIRIIISSTYITFKEVLEREMMY